MFKNKTVIKIISITITAVFLQQQVVWAAGDITLGPGALTRPSQSPNTFNQATFSQTNSKNTTSEQIVPQTIAKDLPISISQETARLESSYINGGKEVVVNIQDCHSSLSAQYSIVNMLKDLVSGYDLRLVAIEGGAGYIDTNVLKSLPNDHIREKTADFLMKEGHISAGEFFAATTDKDIALYGIEDDPLYRKNLELFRDIHNSNQSSIDLIDKALKVLRSREDSTYSAKLNKFIYKRRLHEGDKLSLDLYLDILSGLAEEQGLNMEQFTALTAFKDLTEREKDIDFSKATMERKELISVMMDKLGRTALEELVEMSVAFEKGSKDQGAFHKKLLDMAAREKIETAKYKELVKFTQYADDYNAIDIFALKGEMTSIERSVVDELLRSNSEKELYRVTELFELLKGLFTIELSPEEGVVLQTLLKELNPENVASAADGIFTGEIEGLFTKANEALAFYEVAEARNSAMLSNTVRAMRKEGATFAALISGGHHSEGLTDLMKQKGLSYMVFMPTFEIGKDRPYVAILTKKAGPYKEIATGGRYHLALEAYFDTGDIEQLKELFAFSIGAMVAEGLDIKEEAAAWAARYKARYDSLSANRAEEVLAGRILPEELEKMLSEVTAQEQEDGSCVVSIGSSFFTVNGDKVEETGAENRPGQSDGGIGKRLGNLGLLFAIASLVFLQACSQGFKERMDTILNPWVWAVFGGIIVTPAAIILLVYMIVGKRISESDHAWAKKTLSAAAERAAAKLQASTKLEMYPHRDELIQKLKEFAREPYISRQCTTDHWALLESHYTRAKLQKEIRADAGALRKYGESELEAIVVHEITHQLDHQRERSRYLMRYRAPLKALLLIGRYFLALVTFSVGKYTRGLIDNVKEAFAVKAQHEYEAYLIELEYHKMLAAEQGYRDVRYYLRALVPNKVEGKWSLYDLIAELLSDDDRLSPEFKLYYAEAYPLPPLMKRILDMAATLEGIGNSDKERRRWIASILQDPKYNGEPTKKKDEYRRFQAPIISDGTNDYAIKKGEKGIRFSTVISVPKEPEDSEDQEEQEEKETEYVIETVELRDSDEIVEYLHKKIEIVDPATGEILLGPDPDKAMFCDGISFPIDLGNGEAVDDFLVDRFLVDRRLIELIAAFSRTSIDKDLRNRLLEIKVLAEKQIPDLEKEQEQAVQAAKEAAKYHMHAEELAKIKGPGQDAAQKEAELAAQRKDEALEKAEAIGKRVAAAKRKAVVGPDTPEDALIDLETSKAAEFFSSRLTEAVRLRGKELFEGLKEQEMTIALLKQSDSLFGDHKDNNFLGVNRAVFEVIGGIYGREVLEIVLLVGITHELRHEAGEEDEDKLTSEDVELATDLAILAKIDRNKIVEALEKITDSDQPFLKALKKAIEEKPTRKEQERAIREKAAKERVLDLIYKVRGNIAENKWLSSATAAELVLVIDEYLKNPRVVVVEGEDHPYPGRLAPNTKIGEHVLEINVEVASQTSDEDIECELVRNLSYGLPSQVSREMSRQEIFKILEQEAQVSQGGSVEEAILLSRSEGGDTIRKLFKQYVAAEVHNIYVAYANQAEYGMNQHRARGSDYREHIKNKDPEDEVYKTLAEAITDDGQLIPQIKSAIVLYDFIATDDKTHVKQVRNFEWALEDAAKEAEAAARGNMVDEDQQVVPKKIRTIQDTMDWLNIWLDDPEYYEAIIAEKPQPGRSRGGRGERRTFAKEGLLMLLISTVLSFFTPGGSLRAAEVAKKPETPAAEAEAEKEEEGIKTTPVPQNVDTSDPFDVKLKQAEKVAGYAAHNMYWDRTPDEIRDAFIMLLATANHESHGLKYRKGKKNGSDRGLVQVNRNSAYDMIRYAVDKRKDKELGKSIARVYNQIYDRSKSPRQLKWISKSEWGAMLQWSDALSFSVACIRYRWDRRAIPRGSDYSDIDSYASALADHWLLVYNRTTGSKRWNYRSKMYYSTRTLLKELEARGYKPIGKGRTWEVPGIVIVKPEPITPEPDEAVKDALVEAAEEKSPEPKAPRPVSVPVKAESVEDVSFKTFLLANAKTIFVWLVGAVTAVFFLSSLHRALKALPRRIVLGAKEGKLYRWALHSELKNFVSEGAAGDVYALPLNGKIEDMPDIRKILVEANRHIIIGIHKGTHSRKDKKNHYAIRLGGEDFAVNNFADRYDRPNKRNRKDYRPIGHVHPAPPSEDISEDVDMLPSLLDIRQAIKVAKETGIDTSFIFHRNGITYCIVDPERSKAPTLADEDAFMRTIHNMEIRDISAMLVDRYKVEIKVRGGVVKPTTRMFTRNHEKGLMPAAPADAETARSEDWRSKGVYLADYSEYRQNIQGLRNRKEQMEYAGAERGWEWRRGNGAALIAMANDDRLERKIGPIQEAIKARLKEADPAGRLETEKTVQFTPLERLHVTISAPPQTPNTKYHSPEKDAVKEKVKQRILGRLEGKKAENLTFTVFMNKLSLMPDGGISIEVEVSGNDLGRVRRDVDEEFDLEKSKEKFFMTVGRIFDEKLTQKEFNAIRDAIRAVQQGEYDPVKVNPELVVWDQSGETQDDKYIPVKRLTHQTGVFKRIDVDPGLAVGVEAVVYDKLARDDIEALTEISYVSRIIRLEAERPEERMEEFTAKASGGGNFAAIIDGSVFAGHEDGEILLPALRETISDLAAKVRQDIVKLADISAVPEAGDYIKEITDINKLKGAMMVLLRTMPRSRSYELSEMSLRQIRVEKAYKEFRASSSSITLRDEYLDSRTKQYIAHYADGDQIMSPSKGMVPPGIEINARRDKQGVTAEHDRNMDIFFVTLPEGVKTDDQKRIFVKELMELWMLDGVVPEDNIVLLDRRADLYRSSEIFDLTADICGRSMNRLNMGIRVICGELKYDAAAEGLELIQVEMDTGSRINVNQYRILLNLMAVREEGMEYTIEGLTRQRGGLYIYLPETEPIDLDREVRAYHERFIKEVMTKA